MLIPNPPLLSTINACTNLTTTSVALVRTLDGAATMIRFHHPCRRPFRTGVDQREPFPIFLIAPSKGNPRLRGTRPPDIANTTAADTAAEAPESTIPRRSTGGWSPPVRRRNTQPHDIANATAAATHTDAPKSAVPRRPTGGWAPSLESMPDKGRAGIAARSHHLGTARRPPKTAAATAGPHRLLWFSCPPARPLVTRSPHEPLVVHGHGIGRTALLPPAVRRTRRCPRTRVIDGQTNLLLRVLLRRRWLLLLMTMMMTKSATFASVADATPVEWPSSRVLIDWPPWRR